VTSKDISEFAKVFFKKVLSCSIIFCESDEGMLSYAENKEVRSKL
jgi:hypothetical protein